MKTQKYIQRLTLLIISHYISDLSISPFRYILRLFTVTVKSGAYKKLGQTDGQGDSCIHTQKCCLWGNINI